VPAPAARLRSAGRPRRRGRRPRERLEAGCPLLACEPSAPDLNAQRSVGGGAEKRRGDATAAPPFESMPRFGRRVRAFETCSKRYPGWIAGALGGEVRGADPAEKQERVDFSNAEVRADGAPRDLDVRHESADGA
jgi:hypothetical protein